MITMSKKLDSMMKELKKTNAETFYHCLRVKKLTTEMLPMANMAGIASYSPDEVDMICKGALLHDIGKLYVDNFILTKESYLTPEEKALIQEHVVHGCEAVKKELNPEELDIITDICLNHHERIDGSGYCGKTDLPMYLQIVSICDVFDSLFSDRIYRDGFSAEKTMEMIEKGACGEFDETLKKLMRKISDGLSDSRSI